MRRLHLLVGSLALLVVIAGLAVTGSNAANSPTYRDCSLVGGFDPDYIQLTGASVGPGGALRAQSQKTVKLAAWESTGFMDRTHHVTFHVTVSAPGSPSRKVSGDGTGHVSLKLPLVGSPTGRTNTVDWAAVFDNANHPCPGSDTPQNVTSNPFVIKVTGPACVVPNVVGETLKKAKKALKKADCKLGKVKGPHKSSSKVIKQKPKPGTRLAPGSKVKVTTQ
ncbi:MAG: PASTA domain-containing protein [Actinobacteria bacterium]|nr:MAG: PASTA domain-containing protein [Actinomycetota bacterium]